MRVFLIVAGAAMALFALHRMALYAENRGWIFYKTRPPRVRMLGLLEELVEPSVEFLVEEESSQAIRADQDESGQGWPLSSEP